MVERVSHGRPFHVEGKLVRRLPSGDTTEYLEVYRREWDALVESLEDAMPGWTCYAYDPVLYLRRTTDASPEIFDYVQVPPDIARWLVGLVATLRDFTQAYTERDLETVRDSANFWLESEVTS